MTPTISIVIPAKDEEENIDVLLKSLAKEIPRIKGYSPRQFEVIVVCDNCLDNTEKIARKHKVKVIRRTDNPGKSKALIEGFGASKGNILVMMDADLSHLPSELGEMIDKLHSHENMGLVVASRLAGHSDDATFIRELGGRAMNFFVNIFFGTKLTDAINGFKIFRRSVFEDFDYTADGYAIEIELVANTSRAGLIVGEIPSYEAARAGGVAKSKIIKDGWIFFREIFAEGIDYNINKFLDFATARI